MFIVVVVIICFPDYDVINFIIDFSFFYQAVFLHDRKSQENILNILRTKRACKVK